MLQQDKPRDLVIATGLQHSVRHFIDATAKELDMEILWEGEGIAEKGFWINADNKERNNQNKDSFEKDPIILVHPRYFRPTEVESLLGDNSMARTLLGWNPIISFEQLVAEMASKDLQIAKQICFLKSRPSI